MDKELHSKCWYKNVCDNECQPDCIRYLEMSYLMENSGIPRARQLPTSLTPENIDYEAFVQLSNIKSDIVDFVDCGKNLYLCSTNTGNGKTSWSIKLMLRYFDSVWAGNGFRPRGYFIYVPSFLTKMKDFRSDDKSIEEIKTRLLQADLVIWDDIGSVGLTNYDLSQMLSYLDQRILDGKSNIFTGNLLGDDLKNALGDRLYSRVWGSSRIITLYGNDRRGK